MAEAPEKFIEFSSRSPRIRVRARPGDGVPTVTDGYATIETITRPLRRGLTRWTGSNPMQLSIPILLDGWSDGVSIEPQIADLERMAAVDGGDPCEIAIEATGKLVPHADEHSWYITGLDPGEAILDRRGRRRRQAFTVTVTAVVTANTEKSIARRQQGGHHARQYRVKSGDTLRSIARKVLGDADRWTDIRRLNNITDPRIVGTPGTRKGCIGTILTMPR